VKYLQKIIDDSINVLGVGIIRDYKKSVGESLKFGIMELQRELAKSKAELTQLTDEISLKNQRLQILENQKFKMSSMKDEEDTLTKMRNKISKTSSTFESIRQSREDDKLILQTKDSNKASLWGLNRP
jgi:predicted  nucleic acid-binding Zn-ribbon protein